MYEDQYGEFKCGYWDLKGLIQIDNYWSLYKNVYSCNQKAGGFP